MAKVLIIDGVDFMPYLIDYSTDIEDVDSEKTTRNALGTLTRDRIAVKDKLKLNFRPLTEAELALVLTTVKPPSVSVTYTDPKTSGLRTADFYAGPRNTGKFEGLFHSGASFNITEF